jgi:hypothetical protein
MHGEISVTVVSVTTTTDPLGNTTETTTSTPETVLFAPRASSERADQRSPAVITGATIYKRGPGLSIDPDDRLLIAGVDPKIDGTWQVDGDAGFWGNAGTEVASVRTPWASTSS